MPFLTFPLLPINSRSRLRHSRMERTKWRAPTLDPIPRRSGPLSQRHSRRVFCWWMGWPRWIARANVWHRRQYQVVHVLELQRGRQLFLLSREHQSYFHSHPQTRGPQRLRHVGVVQAPLTKGHSRALRSYQGRHNMAHESTSHHVRFQSCDRIFRPLWFVGN